MPKGTGASGTRTVARESLNPQLDLINRLSQPQQDSFDWLHTPFHQAVQFRDNLTKEEQAFRDRLEEEWKQVVFADIKVGKRYGYTAVIRTSAGEIPVRFAIDYAPDFVRNFICLAKMGYFSGKEIRLDGGAGGEMAPVGSDGKEPLYTLKPQYYGYPPRYGTLVVQSVDGKAPGDRFAFSFTDSAEWTDRVTIFGGSWTEEGEQTLRKIENELKEKPGSVRIDSIVYTTIEEPLFDKQGPKLPRLSEEGRPMLTKPQ